MQSTMYFKYLWCQLSFVFGGIYSYLSLVHTIPVMHLQSGWGIPKAETKERKQVLTTLASYRTPENTPTSPKSLTCFDI